MKLKNGEIVTFMNVANGLVTKRLPIKLMSAIRLNTSALMNAAETYNKQYGELDKKDVESLVELLNVEVEFTCQTIKEEVLELLDTSERFDTLTGVEFDAIQFMIEK